MTAKEKKWVRATVRALEHLYLENCALKTILLHHHIPQRQWEAEVSELTNDEEMIADVHAKWKRAYDRIDASLDEKEVASLLAMLPLKPGKEN